MTVTPGHAPTPALLESAPRLSLVPDGVRPGRLDGAWWPRSRDLLLELPSLAAELDEQWGRVTRITVNPAQWPVIPRRIPVTGHTVHAGWFTTEQDEHMIAVYSYTLLRLNLLVVPPATDTVDAVRLMSEATESSNGRTASELLAGKADGVAAVPEFHSHVLPSAAAPADTPDAAGRRADVARNRAASWPAPV